MSELHWRSLYERAADDYRRYRPTYPPELFAFLAEVVHPLECAWDCASGSGQATEGLFEHVRTVIASDFSRAQLGASRPHHRMARVAARADAAPLRTDRVDLVTIAQALHWFATESFFAEVRRVLRPSGVVAAWCYSLPLIDAEVDALTDRLHGAVVGAYWAPERAHVDAAYRSIPFPFDEISAPRLVQQDAWTRDQLLGYWGTWSAVKAYRDATGREPLDEVLDPLVSCWPRAGERRPVRWPIHLRVGTNT